MTQLNLSGRQSGSTQQKPASKPEDESMKNQTVGALGALAMFAAVIVIGSCSRNDKPVVAQQSVQPAAPVSTPAAQTPVPTPAPVPAVKAKPKTHRAATLSYVNRDYGVSFAFPRNYRLTQLGSKPAETHAVEMQPLMNFVHGGGMALAAVEMPGNSYPETNFKSAFVSLSVNPEMTPEACAQFSVPEPVSGGDGASPVKVGANEFLEVENSDAGMMKSRETKYYHAFSNGACYEFALGVGTEGGGAAETKPVDQKEVFGKLNRILATAKFKSLVTPETNTQAPAAAATAPPDSSNTAEHEAAKPNY